MPPREPKRRTDLKPVRPNITPASIAYTRQTAYHLQNPYPSDCTLRHVLIYLHPILLRLRLLHDLRQRRVLQQPNILRLFSRRLVKRHVRKASSELRWH